MSSTEDLFRAVGSGKRPSGLSEARAFRLILLKRIRLRREGSLAAALTQSMALAVMGTAGAYPSWVLVQGEGGTEEGGVQVVLGAAWAITREDPAAGAPLLGPAGGPLMLGMAFCCLFSVLSGTLALTLDFLGKRRGRSVAPLAHGLTAVLIACAAALGSCLLALVRGRVHHEPELRPRRLRTSPGQSLFLAFLACALASTATGLSCSSPARVEPARSSWDFRARDHRPARFFRHRRRQGEDEEEGGSSSSASSVAAATAAYLKSKYRSGKVPSDSRSGKVHWPDQRTLEYLPEERAFRKRPTMVPEGDEDEEDEEAAPEEEEEEEAPEEGEEKQEEARKEPPALPPAQTASIQRYLAASWSLLGSFGSLFERESQREVRAPPPSPPSDIEEELPVEEEEEEEAEAEARHVAPLPAEKERGSFESV